MRYLKVVIALSAVALTASKCSRAQDAFLTAQLCVVDAAGVDELRTVMRTVAQSEGLEFIDNSETTRRALKDIGADKASKNDAAALIIDFHIEGKRGLGVTAGNFGLPTYQIALGFTEGVNASKARRLANHLIQALSQRWRVETVPRATGVFPMSSCAGKPIR